MCHPLSKRDRRNMKNGFETAKMRILNSNSYAYRQLWGIFSNLKVGHKRSALRDALSRWVCVIIHLHMVILGAFAIFLNRLLKNPKILKPEVVEILSEAWFSASFGATFLACYTLWLIFSVLISGFGGVETLWLLVIAVLGLLFSLELIKLGHRLLKMRIQTAIIAIGNIPLFVLGLPWGIAIFLLIGAVDIVFSAVSLTKNIRFAIRENSHLLITPILVFLLVSSCTGFWDYQSQVNFSESVSLLSSSVLDMGKISDSFHRTKTVFYFGDYQTLNFSFSPLDETTIRRLSAEILPVLSEIEAKSNRSLNLTKYRDPLLMRYCIKSAEALLTGTNLVRTWISTIELMSSMYHQKNITSSNIQKLKNYGDLLLQSSKRLDEIFDDPITSIPIISGWKEGIQEGTEYFVRICKWAAVYYPSINIELDASSEYDATMDLLVVNLQLRNKGSDPIEVYPCYVGTHFEQISWMNYDWLNDVYEVCYRPSCIDFYPNLTVLMPNCSMTIMINFTAINSSLSRFRFDIRTFIQPSIFLVFPETYTQINAYNVFRGTLRP